MSWSDNEIDARQEADRDLDAAEHEIHCPACGQHGCDLIRAYGKGEHADFECGCGWRFRADRTGRVLREFGREAVAS